METRQCTKCGEIKEITEFHKRSKIATHWMCKQCKRSYDAEWYRRNERRRRKLSEAAEQRRKRMIAFVNRYKIFCGCKICGYNKSHHALDLHHLRDKKYDFTNMKTLGMNTIKKEMRKCVVLCANCHREVHGGITQLVE